MRYRIGCVALLLGAVIAFLLTRDPKANVNLRKAIEKDLAEERRSTKEREDRTAAEGRRRAEEFDAEEIRQLTERHADRLRRVAAEQLAGPDAAALSCRCTGWNEIRREDATAWWNGEFECMWPGDSLPNKTSVSVKIAKKSGHWTFD